MRPSGIAGRFLALKTIGARSAAELVRHVIHGVTPFSDGLPQSDDLTLLSLPHRDPDRPDRTLKT